jgi:multimeric flavodoxin WrbA
MKQMSNSNRILVINGSYRDDGITDQTIDVMVQALKSSGSEIETILLREYPIEFCLNCRECTQHVGNNPGQCVQQDDMQALVDKIEQASGYILASPTNLGSVTALFKRFMERLIVYSYWPWEMNYPQFRKAHSPKKKAVLISSCAAPGFFGRWMYGTAKQLKMVAQTIGAETSGTLFTGGISKTSKSSLPGRTEIKARALAAKLISV